MNSTGILDDYLDELLGEAIVAPPPTVLPPGSAGPRPAIEAAAEREPTW
ncbi:MAG TPA: chemotaxis protein CheW, partial [Stenotrophomonas sp.]|nr:chemotaxis protein CheW [Stenotrophomonas sp.]